MRAMSRRLLLVGSSWLIAERAIRAIIGVGVGVLVARHLGAEDFGTLSAAIALAWMVIGFSGLGLPEMMQHEIEAADPGKRGALLGTALAIRSVGGILAWMGGAAVALFLRPGDAGFLVAASIVLSFALTRGCELLEAWFLSDGRGVWPAVVRLIASLLANGLRVVGLLAGAGVSYFAWCFALEGLTAAIGFIVAYQRDPSRRWPLSIAWSVARRLLARLALPACAATMATVYLQLDHLLVLWLVGDYAAGIYGAALRVSTGWYFVPLSLITMAFPPIFRSAIAEDSATAARVRKLVLGLTAIAGGLALAATLAADWLMVLLYGSAFEEAANVLKAHAWTAIPLCVAWVGRFWLFAVGAERWLIVIDGFGLISITVACGLLVPVYGAVGAAWAAAIAAVIRMLSFSLFHEGRLFLASVVGLSCGSESTL